MDEGARSEPRLGVVREPDGDDHHVIDPVVERRFEGNPCRTRPEGLEPQLVVADAFGEHGHHATIRQDGAAGGKGRSVAVPGDGVHGPVDGNDAGQLEEGPQDGDAEEGRLPEEARVAAQRGHQEQPVDQPVRVVGDQDDRPRGWDAIDGVQLDRAEEDPHEHPGQQGHQPLPRSSPGAVAGPRSRGAVVGPGRHRSTYLTTIVPNMYWWIWQM